jgi:O-antigen/teichoic acid export membrane protein
VSLTKKILASSAQLTLANGLARALSLLSIPLLTQWLTPASYGQAALASTLISLISVIALMGMDMSYARSYLSRTPPNGIAVETFCWRFVLTTALLAGIAAALLWLFYASQTGQGMGALSWWILVGACFSPLLAMAQTHSRLHERHSRLAFAVAVGGIAATILTLALASTVMQDERALVSGYIAAFVVPALIMGIPRWQQLTSPSKLDTASRWKIFLIGAPGVVTAPMYWVISSSDRWFLQAAGDSGSVGIYAVACTFGQLSMMVNSALLAIWFPEATRLHEAGGTDNNRRLAAIMARMLVMMGLVWLGVGVLAGDLLRWLSAEQFHPAAALVPWIASGVFFYGCYHIANTGLFLARGLKWSALSWAFVGVFSIVGNAILVPRYGMMAAALVQCGSFALLAVIVLVMAHKRHPLPLPYLRLGLVIALVGGALLVGQALPAVEGVITALWKVGLIATAATLILLIAEPGALKHGLKFFLSRRAERSALR